MQSASSPSRSPASGIHESPGKRSEFGMEGILSGRGKCRHRSSVEAVFQRYHRGTALVAVFAESKTPCRLDRAFVRLGSPNSRRTPSSFPCARKASSQGPHTAPYSKGFDVCPQVSSCFFTASTHSPSHIPKVFTAIPVPRSMYSLPSSPTSTRAVTARHGQRKARICRRDIFAVGFAYIHFPYRLSPMMRGIILSLYRFLRR